jgi:hypothetical protein
MKGWASALETEVAEWPGVSRRPMFGLTALYRGKRIFGLLPRTRGMGSPNSVAFKLEKAGTATMARIRKDARMQVTVMKARRWFVLELSEARDLKDALEWLGRAYEAAG